MRSASPVAAPWLAAAPKPALTSLRITSAPVAAARSGASSPEAFSTTTTRASNGNGARQAGRWRAER